MSGWEMLVGYLLDENKAGRVHLGKMDLDGYVQLTIETASGRSQPVVIEAFKQQNGSSWAQVGCPCGDATRISGEVLLVILRRVEQMIVGGVVVKDADLWLRHTMSLDSISGDVIERSLQSVVSSADMLSRALG